MKVIFYDKKRETYHSVENVTDIIHTYLRLDGKFKSVWEVTKIDGSQEVFLRKDFDLGRVTVYV